MAPRSTRAGHSTLADAPVRATKFSTSGGLALNPIEPRISGQARRFGEHAEVRQVRGAGECGERETSE
jgi:hypothetical protein